MGIMLASCIFLIMVISVHASRDNLIQGGSYTTIYEYPHSVFLMVQCVQEAFTTNTVYHLCGSSILNQRILLTAAHCIDQCDKESTLITAYVGNEFKFDGQEVTIIRSIWHERYDSYTLECDIGMVKTKVPLEFSASVRRVAIMEKPPYNEPAVVAGWGVTDVDTHEQTLRLKKLSVRVMKREDCEKNIGVLPKGTFCAKHKDKNQFFAWGDSGSALVVRDYIQIGLVSGHRPDFERNIGVYTDIGYFYEWIKRGAQDLYCTPPLIYKGRPANCSLE